MSNSELRGSLDVWQPPRPEMSLLDVVAELAGAAPVRRRATDLLIAAILTLPNGRTLLTLERTYRPGVHVIVDPTPEELEIAESEDADLQRLFESERAEPVGNVSHGTRVTPRHVLPHR